MTNALNIIKTIFKKYNPQQPFEYKFVDEDYAKKFDTEVRVGKLATFFAILLYSSVALGFLAWHRLLPNNEQKKSVCVKSLEQLY